VVSICGLVFRACPSGRGSFASKPVSRTDTFAGCSWTPSRPGTISEASPLDLADRQEEAQAACSTAQTRSLDLSPYGSAVRVGSEGKHLGTRFRKETLRRACVSPGHNERPFAASVSFESGFGWLENAAPSRVARIAGLQLRAPPSLGESLQHGAIPGLELAADFKLSCHGISGAAQ
jgi:hypothetical protein